MERHLQVLTSWYTTHYRSADKRLVLRGMTGWGLKNNNFEKQRESRGDYALKNTLIYSSRERSSLGLAVTRYPQPRANVSFVWAGTYCTVYVHV